MDFNLSPSQLALRAKAREVGMQRRGEYEQWDKEDDAPYGEVVKKVGMDR